MKQLLWLKFYPKDWNGDHNLRACSLAARGLLASFLEPMHTAEPYGHLLIRGKRPDYAELASLASCKPREVKYGIEELLTKGVLSQTDDGILFSRRMVRDAERTQKQSQNGKKGAAARYSTTQQGQALTDATPWGSPSPIEARSQRPEARDQRESSAPPSPRTPERSTTRTAPLVGLTSHRSHALCGKVCLHTSQFEAFTARVGHLSDPEKYVSEWYRLVMDRYQTGDRKDEIIGDDMFDFWRKRWAESHPTVDPKAVAGPSAADILAERKARKEQALRP